MVISFPHFLSLKQQKAFIQQLDKLTTAKTSKMIPLQQYYYPFYQYPWYSYLPLAEQWQKNQKASIYRYEPCNDLPLQNKAIMKTQQVMSSQDKLFPPSNGLALPIITSNTQNNYAQIGILKQSYNASPPTKIKKAQVKCNGRLKPQYDKQGRNANSNLLRMFFRNLQQIINADSSIICTIIANQKLKITLTKFEEWFEINKAEHRNYIRLPSIKRLFVCFKNNKQQTKIMRILLQDFIKNEAHLFYLTSKKVKKASMRYNFKSFRNIITDIFETLE